MKPEAKNERMNEMFNERYITAKDCQSEYNSTTEYFYLF